MKLFIILKFCRAVLEEYLNRTPYLMRGFELPMDSGNLVYERNIFSECVERWSRRFGEIGAVERIGII